jgi:hypothetical protein
VEATLSIISGLRIRHPSIPIYYILGNWDIVYQRQIKKQLTEAGAISLESPFSAPVKISRKHSHIWLGKGFYYYSDIRDCPIEDNEFFISLIHYPWNSEVERRAGFSAVPAGKFLIRPAMDTPLESRKVFVKANLFLAGHTHGGQIRLPFIGSLYPIQYAKGLYNVYGRTLYVSAGLGTAADIVRIRFNNPPEINLIQLHCSTMNSDTHKGN